MNIFICMNHNLQGLTCSNYFLVLVDYYRAMVEVEVDHPLSEYIIAILSRLSARFPLLTLFISFVYQSFGMPIWLQWKLLIFFMMLLVVLFLC